KRFSCNSSGGQEPANIEALPENRALVIIAHQAGGVFAVRDFDQIGAANVRVLVNAARFDGPRVVAPSVNLEVFVGVAERKIVNVSPEFVDLRHGQRGNGAIELPLDVGV